MMRRRLPPLRALHAFEAAARHLSFARAAGELGVTPAAISQQIKQLEDMLGTSLFHRGARLSLTRAAAQAAPEFSDAFDRLAGAVGRLTPESASRPLVVSASPAFASRWLVPRLTRFQEAHPEIDLHLSATLRLVDLDREGVDMAVRYGSGRYPGLHVERLRLEEVVAVAAPRLAAGLGEVSDLTRATLLVNEHIGWDPDFPSWPSWLAEMGAVADEPLKLRPFGDASLVVEAALAGLGAALVWRTLISDELAAGRLVALFPGRPLASAYHLVCLPERAQFPPIRAFRDWIMAEAITT
ncbi:Glycine cleavage system transcriptional activator [Paramagnetospirillum magnetotacticum MS-1]|uniref:Glycine cleavage system transcriptional activator n=1 Tax=Paramagnetospirillum magnetotacticum MS-1 TaxID=272627 RepID=A0A0C2U6M8_PARME|nr:transcriptional regulator GcvA [Paramagnetospirillum magnetotacticum]KIL97092.1 Glycine cleavage system transcriptional activator [Paramagnetospirillum magnetotacticum MS-1]